MGKESKIQSEGFRRTGHTLASLNLLEIVIMGGRGMELSQQCPKRAVLVAVWTYGSSRHIPFSQDKPLPSAKRRKPNALIN